MVATIRRNLREAEPHKKTKVAAKTASADQQPANSAERSLMEERLEVLQQRYDVVQSMRRASTISFETVSQAMDDLLLAKADLADSNLKRVAILEQRVANFNELQELVDSQYNSGTTPLSEKLDVAARRLQAEIDLARIKTGDQKEKMR